MAEIEMVGAPVRARKSPNSYTSLALWGLFGLVVVAIMAAQVYVIAAGQTGGRGRPAERLCPKQALPRSRTHCARPRITRPFRFLLLLWRSCWED